MLIIPAVDIKDGKCVRLSQGRFDAVTVYSDDPVKAALKWEALGARLIHIVDLDGAIAGRAVNRDIILKICAALRVQAEIGGGIRDEATADEYLSIGNVRRVIAGTAAVEDPALLKRLALRHPGRIAVGIDAKDGMAAVKGWLEVTGQRAVVLAKRLEDTGVSAIIYTDISRDGMLTGPNIAATREMASSVSIPVIASGGVSSVKDITALRGASVEGVIIGKALYSGDLSLKDALDAAEDSAEGRV